MPGRAESLRTSDCAASVDHIRAAALRGSVNHQYELADMYFHGRGVEQDLRESAKWFLMAAQQGDVQSQSAIGDMYAKGIGVERNIIEASKWWSQAEKQGYRTIRQSHFDYWLVPSADDGDADAQFDLALIMMGDTAFNIKHDREKAVSYLIEAAEQDNLFAMHRLGVAYEKGHGVERDDASAWMWFYMAESGGLEAAIADLHRLAVRLSQQRMDDMKHQAREWRSCCL
jgi:hypothetical protein